MSICTAIEAVKAATYYSDNGGYYEKASGAAKYLTRDVSNFAKNKGSANYSWAGKVCGLNPAEWCAMHVSTAVFEACGGDLTAAKAICWGRWPQYNCGVIMDDAKTKGRFKYAKAYGGTYIPQPGDWVIFTYNGGKTRNHVGMCKAVSGGYIYVNEGNSGNMCRIRSYGLGDSTILGYCLPYYASTSTTTLDTPIAQYQTWLTNTTVDGEYGKNTKAAALYWHQRFIGVDADGEWGWDTYAHAKVCQYGDNNWDSHIVQGQLYCLGYDPQGFDGDFGENTQTAVKKLQADKGLAQTGLVDRDTWALLFGEERPAHTMLKKGISGGEVWYLQTLLWEHGMYIGRDGDFGDSTEDDVLDFQRMNDLETDGIVGSATWAKLEA